MQKIEIPVVLSLIAIVALATACSDAPPDVAVSEDQATAPSDSTSTAAPAPAPDPLGTAFTPVPFPDDLGIPDFQFPEAAVTIVNWVVANPMNTASIYLHGWGTGHRTLLR